MCYSGGKAVWSQEPILALPRDIYVRITKNHLPSKNEKKKSRRRSHRKRSCDKCLAFRVVAISLRETIASANDRSRKNVYYTADHERPVRLSNYFVKPKEQSSLGRNGYILRFHPEKMCINIIRHPRHNSVELEDTRGKNTPPPAMSDESLSTWNCKTRRSRERSIVRCICLCVQREISSRLGGRRSSLARAAHAPNCLAALSTFMMRHDLRFIYAANSSL